MIIQRKLQFAITREDPQLEEELVQEFNLKNVLLICSGGDTILSLKNKFPSLKITAFDFNPLQIAHLSEKKPDSKAGNFESLFRQWKRFFNEFILSEDETLKIFKGNKPFPEEVFNAPYWPASFDLHFHDSFLRAMFGEAAIQHAPKGSYPRYFQNVFEKGLKNPDYGKNPFLQHIFFDGFLDVPEYLSQRPDVTDVQLITGTLYDTGDLGRFDLIQLSNIFDWSNLDEIQSTCRHLENSMKPGAILLLRQINNDAPIEDYLGKRFQFNKSLADKFLHIDRSLFYSRIIVAIKKD